MTHFLESQGHEPFNAETLQEFRDRVHRNLPSVYPAFGELTGLAVEASYNSAPPTNEQANEAERLGREIVKQLITAQTWPVRTAMELDPRPLVKMSDPVAELADRLATGASI